MQIKDLEIIDRVQKSKWNKLLCKDLTKNSLDYTIRLLNDSDEYIDLSITPLRLFINQYTVLFLVKWIITTNNVNTWPIKLRLVTPLSIVLDYKPVRFNTGMGSADLINLFPLQNLHLSFHPATVNSIDQAIEIWQKDIVNSGVSYKYLKSIMIINSLSLMLSGLTDIFIRPYDSVQRDGLGGLLPGMGQGIWSFLEKLTIKLTFE